MKKNYIAIGSAIALVAPLSLSAAPLQPTLEKVAAKVDTDGDFFQVNKFDGDMKVLKEYGELALDLAKANEDDIPKGLKVARIFDILGLDAMKASAVSSKKVDGSWNNKAYLWTGGSQKGILSIYGEANEKLEVAEFAPETTDVALQLRVNLSQIKGIILSIADQAGQRPIVEGELGKAQDEIAGMTPFELIEKLNFRASMAIDLDRKNRMLLPGADAPGVDFVARLDGASWAWKMFGDQLLQQTPLPWKKTVEGPVTTYSLPAEAAKQMMGYAPVIRIDAKHIWMASKPTMLEAALGDGKKLKDGAGYKTTMATLPKSGNSVAYFSKDLLDELVYQYETADKNGLLDDRDFRMAKPLVDKIIADLTKSDSGIAAVIQVDADGINSVLRAPFPVKNYMDKLAPYLNGAAMAPIMERQMRKSRFR